MKETLSPPDLFLCHQIEQMVSIIGQLQLEQIYRMFRRYDKPILNRHIYILYKEQNRINFDGEKIFLPLALKASVAVK